MLRCSFVASLQYQGTVGLFNYCCLIHFKNCYQHCKYYLYDSDIAFGVISSSYNILIFVSIFSLTLSFGIFLCNTIKIFLCSRFTKIEEVFFSMFVFTFFVFFTSRKLFLSGDIETNSGQKPNLNNFFTFDIVFLSETRLNDSFPFDDDNLDIPGYIMARTNHPANSKRGGVCMYFTNCLPLKFLNIKFLHETIAFDL